MDERDSTARRDIDKIISNYGIEILESVTQNGVIVEGQFNLTRRIIEHNLDYLQEKLTSMGEWVWINDKNVIYNSDLIPLTGSFFPQNFEEVVDGIYFYYAYYADHKNNKSIKKREQVALKVYKEH